MSREGPLILDDDTEMSCAKGQSRCPSTIRRKQVYTCVVDIMWTGMNKRINIVLPEATIRKIGRFSKRGERSRFIDQAVQHYAATRTPQALREQLERTAVRDRDLERQVSDEWFAADQEVWDRLDEKKQGRKRTTRNVGRSTSRRSTRP